MLKQLFLLALVLLVTHSEVITLDDLNYTTFIEQHPYVFVQFYAPWCGHCKKLAPQYQKLGKAAQGKQYVIAKVDATQSQLTAKRVGVQGYPTLKFVVKGYYVQYKGPRNAKGIQEWIQSFLSSKIVPLTQHQVKEKIGSEDFLLIQGANADQLRILETANAVDGTIQYYSLSSQEAKITLYLKNSKTLDYTGDLSVEALTSWTRATTLPIFVPLSSHQNIKLVFQNQQQIDNFLLLKKSDFSQQSFDALSAICEENKTNFKCSYVDQTHEVFEGVAKYLKAEDTTQSVLAYIKYKMSEGYAFPNLNDITKQTVKQFLEDIKEGKVQKLIDGSKSETKEIKYEHVLKLTTENYNQTLQTNKYVFVQYYSPNCGHCVKFAPQYDELAQKLKEQNSEFLIAAVDMVAEFNISEWVSINGYPTLRLYVNGNQLQYEGGRTSEQIIAFFNSVTTAKLLTAASVNEIPKPAVAIYGIPSDSLLNLLPVTFTKYPIYHIAGDSSFKIQIHTEKQTSAYAGSQAFQDVLVWLEETSEPLLVNIVAQNPSKKLSKSLQSQVPILVIVERDDSAQAVRTLLQTFCLGRFQLVCGYATKGFEDYDSYNEWLNDPVPQKSRLVYLKTETFQKYFYSGDLTTLTSEDLQDFIKQVQAGTIKPHEPKEQSAQEEQPPTATEPNEEL